MKINLRKTIQVLIITIYLGTGIILFFRGWYLLSPSQNRWVGTIIVIYAIFRAFRMIYLDKKVSDDE